MGKQSHLKKAFPAGKAFTSALLLFLLALGAFIVAAGAVAAAASLPAAVLADKQDRQRQQNKNNYNNNDTCHVGYLDLLYCVTQSLVNCLHSVPQMPRPMQ